MPFLFVVGKKDVLGDPAEPSADLAASVIALDAADRTEKGLLRQLLREISRAGFRHQKPIGCIGVLSVDCIKVLQSHHLSVR